MNVQTIPVPTRLEAATAGPQFILWGNHLLRAFRSSDADTVRALAKEYLQLAESNRQSKNYGNAIHQANTVLGLLALENDHVDRAEFYLAAAGRTPGSSQLAGFGPNMLLAHKLLKAGRSHAVLKYLDCCSKFWKLSFGKLWMWKFEIRRGRVPNFGANLSYLLDPKSFG
ncbi:hypothetical protein GGR28_000200 [Lewinella aquimaris]|uniref:Uncharacterized protein n=1 Tax=Neolewinella aquimaris TaxID=1835722 RepID=A0A840E723_9BACT|nr:hypothetical protein [Neolewinella aquimaris]MBB4077599.1 hypothetical protein [Neolewinella aquimaris]